MQIKSKLYKAKRAEQMLHDLEIRLLIEIVREQACQGNEF